MTKRLAKAITMLSKLDEEQTEELARALPPEALLSALCALEGSQRSTLLAELRWDDSGGKYYNKARVYGAVAAQYRETLEHLARAGSERAKAALLWRESELGGVPRAELEAFEALMRLSPAVPVPMVLHCPECRARHVDEGEFATKVHHTQSCQSCGLTWRPAVVATIGVQFLPGFKNETP
ncbi:MAG TPA: hypothetical protein VH062_02010 [Polyangiaceae bacterium]|jgi:hypothetical protein|nr:hypothetical protein [Polyangiaceae bacterium]